MFLICTYLGLFHFGCPHFIACMEGEEELGIDPERTHLCVSGPVHLRNIYPINMKF